MARIVSLLVTLVAGDWPRAPNLILPVDQLRDYATRTHADRVAEIVPEAKGDITRRRKQVRRHAPLRVKVESRTGAEAFNNVPRYDLAAYELQVIWTR
jgi:hypothetical protein